jgi:predicted DNA-binding mobile mystery protein A
MNNQKRLIIKQLDSKIRKFRNIKEPFAPSNGWLLAIRTALGMPRRSVAKRLQISEPTLQGIEKREVEGNITLKTLRETAAAMDLELVYGFVPREGSLQNYIRKKTYEVAKHIVLRTAHTMALEDQAISDNRTKAAIKEKAKELELKLPSFLWD